MSVSFYVDEHVHGAIIHGLRRRGVDLLTVQDDGYGQEDDPILLDRALTLERVMVTQDKDFLREGARRQVAGEPFAGVAYAAQDLNAIGRYVTDLELIAKIDDLVDWMNQVKYLPL
jgi:predicted nuclease of predicted toxin-antitoxin system